MQHIWLIYLAAEHLLSSLYTGSFPSHLLRIFKKIITNCCFSIDTAESDYYWRVNTKGKLNPQWTHNVTCTGLPDSVTRHLLGQSRNVGMRAAASKGEITAALSDNTTVITGWTLLWNDSFTASTSFVSHSHTEVFSFMFGFRSKHK